MLVGYRPGMVVLSKLTYPILQVIKLQKTLTEKQTSFKRWPMDFWWISSETTVEIIYNVKTIIFKICLYLNYKNTFFCESTF